jgi:hypothetical protein
VVARSFGGLAGALARVPIDEIKHISLLVADAAANFYVTAPSARRALAFDRPPEQFRILA